jgi:hypothetical protein
MRLKLARILIIVVFSLSITSCSSSIEFDLKRYAFVFITTLVIGVVGLIIAGISGSNNNK